MKTIKEFRDHFSAEEIKLLKEIVCGKLEFSVLEEEIKDFYDGENFEPLEPTPGTYIDKLEFDMEYVRLI
jgi:hypothetical protein